MDTDLEDQDEETSGATLIRTFGEMWSRDLVEWDSKMMRGERRKYKKMGPNAEGKIKECNVWHQHGIYALYDKFKLVYVGQATSSSGIGGRLYEHSTKSRFHRQWDSFSWFSLDGLSATGERQAFKVSRADESLIARTLELVTILIAEPALNRSRGRFKNAERIVQARRKVGEDSMAILERIEAMLTSLSASKVKSM